MPPTGFEPTIPEGEQVQTHTLDRAATGISRVLEYYLNIIFTGELPRAATVTCAKCVVTPMLCTVS